MFLRKVFITVLIFAWIFFGWPKIWQNSPFPPKIQQALAAEVAIDTTVSGTIAAHQKSSKQNVCISDTVCYVFYIEADSDINYQKSTDGGASWGGTGTDIDVGTFFALAIWYDRWTPGDTTGNLVHIVYLVGTHDLVYAVFNTSDDSFTAGVVIAASGAQGSLGAINDVAVSKGTDGDLYAGTVDATIPTSPASFFINVPAPAPRTPTGFQPVLTHGTALAMIRARHMPLLYCPCQTTQRTTRAI